MRQTVSAYTEIPDYFRYYSGISVAGSAACTTKAAWQTALKDRLNIFIVLHDSDPSNPTHDPNDQTANITSRINAAKNTANTTNRFSGALAFEPGYVYKTKPILIEGSTANAVRGAVVGVFGNGATLRAIPGGTTTDALLKVGFCHVSQDYENDLYGFFLSDLNIDVDQKYASGFHLTKSKFFQVSRLTVVNAQSRGVFLSGVAGEDIYYGMLDQVASQYNGLTESSGVGFELSGANQSGIRVANVGFYRCRSQFNKHKGVNITDSSVMFADSVISGDRTYEIETTNTYSSDFVNCQVSGAYNTSKEVKITNNGNTFGFHFLGGRLRNRYNNSPSANVGVVDYGGGSANVKHSMIHTQDFARLPATFRAFATPPVCACVGGTPPTDPPAMKGEETNNECHQKSCNAVGSILQSSFSETAASSTASSFNVFR